MENRSVYLPRRQSSGRGSDSQDWYALLSPGAIVEISFRERESICSGRYTQGASRNS